MSISQLLIELRENQISVHLKDKDLLLNFSGKEVPAVLLEKVRDSKGELIAYLEKYTNREEYVAIQSVEEQESYSLSPSQKRLWVLSQYPETSRAYIIANHTDLPEAIELTVLKQAIQAVIARHEILRTVFRENEAGEIRQYILTPEALSFEIATFDLSDAENPVGQADEYMEQDGFRLFDLESGPLIRACLLRLSEKTNRFYYAMHHLISDGWSLEVLIRDVLKYYEAIRTGTVDAIAPLSLQYKDYANWQLSRINRAEADRDKAYWTERFSREIPVVDLPANKVRPAVKTNQGELLEAYLGRETSLCLFQFTQEEKGSIFITLLALVNLLIYRYTGQQDIIIGTAVAGRGHADLEEQIGFYVNTLPLWSKLIPSLSFRSYYGILKEKTLVAFSHESFPFDLLVEELNLQRDFSRNPLFDIMLTFQDTDAPVDGKPALPDSLIEPIHYKGRRNTKFDIEINVVRVGDYLRLTVNYNSDIYNQHLLKQFIGHFQRLTQEVLSDPEKIMSSYDYLETEEKALLLQHFNNTQKAYPNDKGLMKLFQDQVSMQPDAPALCTRADTLSYRELNERANQLAHFLRTVYKIGADDLVGIKLRRSEALIISIFAVLKAGGAYVPIDPNNPEERRNYIENDADCKCTIGLEFLRGFAKVAADYPITDPDRVTNADSLVYVIYTSGSTGRPKGVMIEERALLNRLYWMQEAYPLGTDDVILQKTTYAFDVSVWELIWWSLNGAAVYLLEDGAEKIPARIVDAIENGKVTVTHFVPSMLGSFLTYLNNFPDERKRISSLRQVFTSGEALTKEQRDDFFWHVPQASLMNLYGPTEAAIDVSYYDCNKEREDALIPIGKPIANIELHILDDHLQLVPVGVRGELHIAGVGLARGYLNKPELTADRFIEHPFKPGEEMYKTGDVAYRLPDGNINFLGRIDHQVKIRGYRIELGEIEYNLRNIDQVKEVIVATETDIQSNKYLIAYLVCTVQPDVNVIRRYLEDKLPDYMIPARFIRVKQIPLNANGKADRRKLQSLHGQELKSETTYIPPANAIQQALVSVCEEVLLKERIGMQDSFFNLGGDSIKSIQIVSRLKQKGFRLRVEEVLKHPVLENMARAISQDAQVISQEEVVGPVALTPIQHYLFSHYSEPQYFNQSILLKSKRPIRLDLLESCLHVLLQHHDALRMVFKQESNGWRGFNGRAAKIKIDIHSHDLRKHPNPLKEMKQIAGRIQSSFDLVTGPLCKVGHFRIIDGERLAIIVHHLVIDGVSWRILQEDLLKLFQLSSSNQPLILSEKTHSFQYWSERLQKYGGSDQLQRELPYWEDICAQKVVPIDTDRATSEHGFHHEELRFELSEALTNKLQTNFHHIYNTEINDVLLTALGGAIADVFDRRRVFIDMEGHGREPIFEDMNVSRTIGWFTTLYPLLLDLTECSDPALSLIRVKEIIRQIPNKGIGFGILKYLSDQEYALDYTPSVVFNYLGDFDAATDGTMMESGWSYAAESIGSNISKKNADRARLSISGAIASGKLGISIHYAGKAFKKETIEQFAHCYERRLGELIKRVNQTTKRYKTPSDLTYSALTLSEIDSQNQDGLLEDIYELSPLQEGIYYHWLRSTSKSLYLEQIAYRVHLWGANMQQIRLAYCALIQRHAVLRTSFVKGLQDIPLQVVKTKVQEHFSLDRVPQDLQPELVEDYVQHYKENDRQVGFDLGEQSLIRLNILQLETQSYEFIWSHHHILMDGWCMSILIQDFNAILQKLVNKRSLPSIVLGHYSEYIKWLRKVNVEESLDYWKNYLDGYTQVATLPFKQHLERRNDRISTVQLKIEGEVFQKTQQLITSQQITQSTFVQTVWGLILSRYNLTNDVVFGAVVSGRPPEISGVENMVGLFINTIPVRVQCQNKYSLKDLFGKVQQAAISGQQHHYLNLAKVQQQSELGSELINHILVIENFPIQEAFAGMDDKDHLFSVESVNVFEHTNYNFNLVVIPSTTSITLEFRFNDSIFAADKIHRLSTHLRQLIESVVTSSGQTVDQMDCLPVAERDLITETFNATDVDYSLDITVVDLFGQSIISCSDCPAVSDETATLNYGQLNELSDQLAYYLQQQCEVESGDLVSIRLERSCWMLVSIWGVLKARAAYVPLGIDYPTERVQYMTSDSGSKVTIDTDLLSDFKARRNHLANDLCLPSVSPSDLAYAIYTSGSTGQPKGVLNDHAGLYNRLQWMGDNLEVGPDDVFLQKTPYTFDVSVWELLLPALRGSRLVFARPEGHKDPHYLQELIAAEGVSIIHFVPSMLGIFLEELVPVKCQSLRHIICSGEALPSAVVETCKQRLPWVRIHNLYGPTEAAIDVTAVDLTEVDTATDGVSIGRPIANTRVYVVDQRLRLQPIGVPGELLIEGIQVARGYLNKADLTAERFLDSPFRPGARAYRTGDLAKWLPDGQIAYLGRMDNQVKVRGNRIELGEIESKLMDWGQVERAAVLVNDEGQYRQLVAYVVPKTGYEKAALLDYLQGCLPEYMIPGIVIELEELPLTVSGKLNRRALPKPDAVGLILDRYVAPRDELEKGLVGIWQEVLSLSRVGIEDNFFRIGGDSILSIRAVSRINKQFGANVTIAQLYQFSTIAQLAGQLKDSLKDAQNQRNKKAQIEEKIDTLKASILQAVHNQDEIEDIYPMRDIQRGMVMLSGLNPGSGVYHDQFLFHIPTVDTNLFKKAFDQMIRKHAVLRTRFDLMTFEEEVQVIYKTVDYEPDYQDLKGLEPDKQEAFIKDYLAKERAKIFDITKDLLWRITLFNLTDHKHIFLFQFHHAILDGWSVASLNTELFKTYYALLRKPKFQVKKLAISNRDAVIEELYEREKPENLDFWKAELHDYKRLTILSEEPTSCKYTHTYDFVFKKKLEDRCRQDDLSLKHLIYAAYCYVLKYLSFEEDFVVGLVTHNRPVIKDGDELLGCFLNTIPVRNRLQGLHDMSWLQYYQWMESQLTTLKERERLTLYEISRVTQENTMDEVPFFDVIYNYVHFHIYDNLQNQSIPSNVDETADLNIDSFERTNTAFDLNVSAAADRLILEYNLERTIRCGKSLSEFHNYLDKVLHLYLNQPTQKIQDTNLLGSAERDLITETFNATDVDYSLDITVVDLFGQSIISCSDCPAVSDETATLNYGQLNELSDQLAYYLQQQCEVESGDLVSIRLERSCWMLVSIWGVLKARAAYVPLGIDYPTERVQYMTSDSGSKVTIDTDLLSDFKARRNHLANDLCLPSVSPSDLAYAIYTSGSTGQPKGVLNDHAGLYNRLQWMGDNLEVGPDDVFLQKTPYTFDVSVWELLLPALRGSRLVFARPEGHKDPHYLQELIAAEGVSIIHFVPSMLGIFLEELVPVKCQSLRHIICSGEALPSAVVETCKQRLPWVRIHNLYGPTEAAIDVTAVDLTEVDTATDGVSIGRPIANTRVYVVDQRLRLQPIGVPGELLIEGIQVARGYLNKADLTAERFLDSPFRPGARAYRTGDLAKWLPDGQIAYLGRMDNQVKVRGNRIELGEIESKLMDWGQVERAAVLVNDEGQYRQLVAYVVPKTGYEKAALLDYLQGCLPEYMIPGIVIELEELPLTVSGKLNRRALPKPDAVGLILDRYVAPRDELEKGLVGIWQEVLSLSRVGIEDNFFRIGGDSILSIRAVSRINKQFGANVTIAQLYQFSTIAQLAGQLRINASNREEEKNKREKIRQSLESLRAEVIGKQ